MVFSREFTMFLQIIIPVLNEADNLRLLLPYLLAELGSSGRIIVSDGGSTDGSKQLCQNLGVAFLPSPKRGRGPQMNAAVAAYPEADVYYFVHADTRPPRGFIGDISAAVAEGFPIGCYRFRFDVPHPLLAINAFCTRFKALAFRGGDQSLFVARSTFEALGAYREDMLIMEDYDIIERAQQQRYPFRILPKEIVVSARKYRHNSYLRVQLANWRVFRMYRQGADQEELIKTYRTMLKSG